MGRYIGLESVLVRLRGKVKVTENPQAEPDRMPLLLLNRLINEAEGQVEMDLSQRYSAPFQTIQGGSFSQLPERPTKEILRTLCELLSVIRVLETDFGRGSAVDGAKYSDAAQKRYNYILFGDSDKKIPGLLTLRENTYNVYVLPPMPGLQSGYHMSAVDTGFSGFVGRSDDHGFGSYGIEQINSPSENFWNGTIEAPEDDHTGDW